MIEIQGLSFRYPGADREALHQLSLKVRPGSLFGLLGPNGSGKTTLISILTGLLTPAAGRLRVQGKALPAETRAVQAESALVPQDYAFYPRLTVRENLNFFAGVLELGATRETGITQAVEVAGLQGFLDVRAEHLSGGLKRRLNLAIGLLNRPRLLLLDEPTVGIDPQSRQFILAAIKRINATGTTVVYTSHYMEEVEALCDEIGVLDQGRLLAHGSLSELLGGGDAPALEISLAVKPNPKQRKALAALRGVVLKADRLRMERCSAADLKRVLAKLSAQKLGIGRMQYGYGNLEEVFLHLTGRQLRD